MQIFKSTIRFFLSSFEKGQWKILAIYNGYAQKQKKNASKFGSGQVVGEAW